MEFNEEEWMNEGAMEITDILWKRNKSLCVECSE